MQPRSAVAGALVTRAVQGNGIPFQIGGPQVINALDCITLGVASPDAARRAYALLLGRDPGTNSRSHHLQLANTRLQFAAKPSSADEGLAGIAFDVTDLDKARHLLERRAVRTHLEGGDTKTTGRLHLATDSTHGVPMSLVERKPQAVPPVASGPDTVSGLDHVVIRTPNPERAVALYAGRLGLSLRLDRTEPSWGARLLFFRCGDLIVELAHDLKAGVSNEPDRLWGLSWRVPNIAREHARVKAAGVEVSDIRTGRRPGTRIFTVRSHTAGVPTIIIGPDEPGSA